MSVDTWRRWLISPDLPPGEDDSHAAFKAREAAGQAAKQPAPAPPASTDRYHPETGQYLGNAPYQKPYINCQPGGEEWGGRPGSRQR